MFQTTNHIHIIYICIYIYININNIWYNMIWFHGSYISYHIIYDTLSPFLRRYSRISLPRPPAPVFAVHRISCQAPVTIGHRCHMAHGDWGFQHVLVVWKRNPMLWIGYQSLIFHWELNWILKWRYVSTICLAIFCGDIHLHRPEK